MFRNDFEFNDRAAPSHLGHGAVRPQAQSRDPAASGWSPEAERELQKVPFFVRGKARRNTEKFAAERGLSLITVETLYDAKSYYSR